MLVVKHSISIACSWRLVYCTRQWVCDASLRNCRIESTRNIHHLLWLWEYYGNMMGILWEYDGNMMGILWEYYGNINGSHARHSNLAVNCRLASPELGFWRSHAGFRSLGSCQPREHSKYTTRYDQRSGHSLEILQDFFRIWPWKIGILTMIWPWTMVGFYGIFMGT